jgi:regulator of protease activity HflC (stomatin/prohibitin superfamily)
MSAQKEATQILAPIFILGSIAILLKLHPFIHVTEPGTATVVFNSFTGLQIGVRRPGISFVWPLVDQVTTYPTRTKVLQFTNEPSPNQAGPALKVNSADGQAFSIDVYIALRPNEAFLDDLHRDIGPNFMSTTIIPIVRAKIRDVSASFNSEAFYQQEARLAMETEAKNLISTKLPTTEQDGRSEPLILVEGVFLGSPYFPENLKESIEQKQVASITAQTAAVKARIQSKETERILILAKANQTAIELKGKASAINAQLADFLFYERLEDRIEDARRSGNSLPLNVIQVAEETTVFLNIDPRQAAAITKTTEPTAKTP